MPQALALRASTLLGTRAVDTRPTTWQEEDLSIEVAATTETPTRMRVWYYDREVCSYRSREFDEILDITGMRQEDLDAAIRGRETCQEALSRLWQLKPSPLRRVLPE